MRFYYLFVCKLFVISAKKENLFVKFNFDLRENIQTLNRF